MGKKINLTGMVFGKLKVLRDSSKRVGSGNVVWECQCDCGRTTYVNTSSLVREKGTMACRSCSKKGCPNPRKDLVPVECLNCGKTFTVKRYREKTATFCSRKCNAKYNYDPLTFTMAGKRPWNKRVDSNMRRLSRSISQGIRHSLLNGKQNCHWENMVGYKIADLKTHLEKQFFDGMSWDNYGKWHIDHIVPISAFNFSEKEHIDFKRCWALKNLRPLWAIDNIKKQGKLQCHFQPSLRI